MKKIGIILFGLIGILLILKLTFYKSEFKEYIPLVFIEGGIKESPEMLTEKHKEMMVQVLNYYKEKWKFEKGKLFISKKIDNDLLWNYTSKANDTTWIKEHVKHP